MFRRLMTLVTAATFVAHGLWGCCWHHARNCPGHDEAPSSTSQPSPCCKHHHRAPQERKQAPAAPCNLHCKGVCVYVSQHKMQIDAPQSISPFDTVPAVSGVAGRHCLAIAFHDAGPCGPLDSGPPLRLHLLYQVQLI